MDPVTDILDVEIHDWGINVFVGPVLIGLVVVVLLVRVLGANPPRSRWKPQEVRFNLGGVVRYSLLPDDDVARIAHEAWTELATRKAGIEVDEDDVIAEVYDSWYALFRTLRVLARQIPVRVLHRSADGKRLLETLVDAMNKGLRPHLTKHQATYRAWWERASKDPELRDLPPKQRQQAYPEYDEVLRGMRRVNSGLIEMAESLRCLAHERQIASVGVRLVRLIRPSYKTKGKASE